MQTKAFLYLFPLGDIACNVDATHQAPGGIPQRRDAHEEIARKPFFVDLDRMFLTVLE